MLRRSRATGIGRSRADSQQVGRTPTVGLTARVQDPEPDDEIRTVDRGPDLPHPSRGDQDGLEVHDERAAMIVDGRADFFEETVLDLLSEGGVVAP